jgi:signal peptidase I
VYVDGRLLFEPYLPSGTITSDFAPTVVPAGYLWVMGDNRGNSTDSRVFGPIKRSTVVGRTILRVWPPGSASFL